MPMKSWADLVEDAGDTDFKALPQADYDLKIIKSEPKQASSGKTMFAITCEVVEGPHKGRRVWSNMVVSPENPQALNIFFRQMAAIGIDRSFFATNPSDHNVAQAMEGKEFRGSIKVKQYQGNDRNEIAAFARTSRGSVASPVPPTPVTASSASTPRASGGVTPGAQPAPGPTASGNAEVKSAAVSSTPEAERVTQAETPAIKDEPVVQATAAASSDSSDTPPPPPF
ncbi:hypothetical protein PP304_gp187 [Gordonia phage Phendrix]|uniref:DUF669 domain-containing protein n=1 Tax=Gordonia phage Phendrix TaxID=2593335 RepID=A0A514U163_9CAUD|nr:hypothetical protein PP304_gp187 [Gordonia phage Phendrix]QDK02683.1 hypothetical protein SEA_PHENDRIX_166 [Gordonia phage Phendrix]